MTVGSSMPAGAGRVTSARSSLLLLALVASHVGLSIITAEEDGEAQVPQRHHEACRRKQFPLREGGRCAFVCPRNSCVKPERACVDEIGDCKCKRGYLMDVKHEACVIDATECRREPPKGSPGCTYKCPLNSCIKPGRSCVDSFEDCGCIHGYTADHSSHRCVIDIGSSKWARSRIGMAGVEAPATTNEGADVSDLSLESEYQAEPVVPGNASRPITLTVHSSGAKLLHMKSTASVLGSLGDEDQDPQAELSTTLAELVLLGTQMTLVLAFVRGLVHLYTLHTDGSSDVLATLQAFWRKHRGAREWLESSGETLKQGATATRRPSITSCHHL